MRMPTHVQRFQHVLLDNLVDRMDLELGRTSISGHRGIFTTSHIKYNDESFNVLGRHLEYSFKLSPSRTLEVSLQLYMNTRDHWRLFAHCSRGMLFSVNLTTLRKRGQKFTIFQTLKLSAHSMAASERVSRTRAMCRVLQNLGLDVDQNNRLILGSFDAAAGKFIDISPKAFLRLFLTTAVVKGHYMGNKGYSLAQLPRQPQFPADEKKLFKGRSIPLSIRYQILEKSKGKCCLCGKGPKQSVILHVDHIKPVSQGGQTEARNLQVLCADCNLGKGNRSARRIK